MWISFPAAATSEYLAEFRNDIAAYVPREVVQAYVDVGTVERPPRMNLQYVGFIDPSGGSSGSMTLSIGRREGENIYIDALREIAGQRTVPIGPYVVNTLREWKIQQPATGSHNLVFGNKKGNIESHPNIVKRGLAPPQIAAGMADENGKAKYPGLHALRHFYASWCINRREDGGLGLLPKMVQDRMGHSTLAMTMDTYGHLFPSTDDTEALAAAEQALLSAV